MDPAVGHRMFLCRTYSGIYKQQDEMVPLMSAIVVTLKITILTRENDGGGLILGVSNIFFRLLDDSRSI